MKNSRGKRGARAMASMISRLYHDERDGPVGCESFRDGFIPGARLMMEVACGRSRFSDAG